jgi:hypothetical protein
MILQYYCNAHTYYRFEEVRNDAARSPPFGAANRQHSYDNSSSANGSAGGSYSYTAAAATTGVNDDDLLSAGDDSFDEDTQWKTATSGTGTGKTTSSSRGSRTDNEGPGEGIRWKRGEQVRQTHM